MKPPKQNQELQNKGKRRAAGSTGDDPIESFPDEGPKAAGSSSGQSSLRSSEGVPFPSSMLQLYNKLDNLRNQVCHCAYDLSDPLQTYRQRSWWKLVFRTGQE